MGVEILSATFLNGVHSISRRGSDFLRRDGKEKKRRRLNKTMTKDGGFSLEKIAFFRNNNFSNSNLDDDKKEEEEDEAPKRDALMA